MKKKNLATKVKKKEEEATSTKRCFIRLHLAKMAKWP